MHLLGVIHHQQGRHEEALELIGRAIAASPGKPVYFNNYGAVLLSLNRSTEAVASFQRVAIRADYVDAWANLGLAHTALSHKTEAILCLRKALEIDPAHRDARRRLATLLQDLGSAKKRHNSSKRPPLPIRLPRRFLTLATCSCVPG